MYDTKIAIVVLESLLPWQKLNVAAFLASAVAIEFPETHGDRFVDASDVTYLPFIRQPMLVYSAAGSEVLQKVYGKARARSLGVGIYTAPLFATKGEAQNHAEIRRVPEHEQDYVGLVLYGENKLVDKAVKGLKFHS